MIGSVPICCNCGPIKSGNYSTDITHGSFSRAATLHFEARSSQTFSLLPFAKLVLLKAFFFFLTNKQFQETSVISWFLLAAHQERRENAHGKKTTFPACLSFCWGVWLGGGLQEVKGGRLVGNRSQTFVMYWYFSIAALTRAYACTAGVAVLCKRAQCESERAAGRGEGYKLLESGHFWSFPWDTDSAADSRSAPTSPLSFAVSWEFGQCLCDPSLRLAGKRG